MAARADEDEPVLAVGQHFEAFGAHIAGDDADIGGAVGDRAHDARAQTLAQVDIDIAMRRKESRQYARAGIR